MGADASIPPFAINATARREIQGYPHMMGHYTGFL